RSIRNPVFETSTGSIVLLLQVANFDHRVGGMWRPIWIGAADEVAAYDIIDISYDLLLLGICLAFAAYNVLIYMVSSRRVVAPLLFALFFLSVSVRVPTLGAVLATRAFPRISWHALIFIEYMTGHLIIGFFCSALQLSYPRILGRAFRLAALGLMSAFSIYLVIAGVTRYSLIIHAFLVVVVLLLGYPVLRLGWASVRGARQTRFGLLAVLVVLGVVVSEWAHFSELVLSRDGTPVGFLLGALSAPPGARIATHLAVTSGALLLVLAAASLLLYKISDGLFGAATREVAGGIPEAIPSAVPASTAPADTMSDRQQTFRNRFGLTAREAEIAALAAEGLSNKEIAAVLTISEATVRTHIYRIFKKTQSQNRTELSKTYFTYS
ncbi:MAG TPA: LuxR C-terminal-related transcriptional regulator, partial [Alkalispirochaeta sp.]|nr:LuxR C-terminal-related transcriptional regulator [Alkalispirochaeta sp.]